MTQNIQHIMKSPLLKRAGRIAELLCIFIILNAVCLSACLAQPLPDENIPYSMISLSSEHFVVRYPKNVHQYATKTIDYAEHAYALISRSLKTQIDDRITIQLLDRVDTNNYYKSSADLNDFFVIYLWPSQSVLENNYHGDWLEEAISSGITRILIQRTHSDFIHSYNNMLLPAWYLDGVSYYYEVPEMPGKPFHRGLMNAIIRSAAQSETFPMLDALTAGSKHWMGQEIAKIYGTAFVSYIVKEYGIQSLAKWNLANASSFSTIDKIAEHVFGFAWETLYDRWIETLKTQTLYDAKKVTIPSKQDISERWRNELVQIVPGKHAISYVRDDGKRPRAIMLHDLDTGEESTLVECTGRCEHHWTSDGQTLYFSSRIQTARYESETLFSLKMTDIFPRKVPLPGHVRGFTLDQDYIISVSLLNDTPVIYQFNPDTKAAKQLFSGKPFELIEGIVLIDDNRWAASVYDPDARQFDLVLFTHMNEDFIASKLTHDAVTEKYPFRTNDGRIGYITEQAGYFMINAIMADGSGHELLHVHDTGMVQPVQSENGSIYYTDISSEGMAIATIPKDGLLATDIDLSTNIVSDVLPRKPFSIRSPERLGDDLFIYEPARRPWGIRTQPAADTVIERSIGAAETKLDDGFDWSVLVPDSYSPMFGSSDATGWYLGLGVDNYDYLKHHHYHVHFAWFFDRNTFDLELTYRWHRYRWYLESSVGVKQKTQTIDFGDSYKYYPYTNYFAYLETGSKWQYPLIEIHFSVKALAEYTKTNDHSMDELLASVASKSGSSSDAMDMHQFWSNALIAELELKHIHQVPNSIPGKTGYTLNFNTRVEMPQWGNRYYTFSNTLDIGMSWSMPWRETEVFGISYLYGFALSEHNYRYPLELQTGSGFGFNDLVRFHGIRAGNLISNNHLMHAHAQYTIPLVNIQRNRMKIPFAFNRIGVGLLGDWAMKSDKQYELNPKASMFGLGAELYIDSTLGYNYPVRMGLGYEKGFASAGEDAFYLWLTL